MAQRRLTAGKRAKSGTASWAALWLAVIGASGCVTDGGPHPEPPIELGPPSSRDDAGPDVDGPTDEGESGAGAGGSAGAGGNSAGFGGFGGAGGIAGGQDAGLPRCEDAEVDAGCDDEDAGALR